MAHPMRKVLMSQLLASKNIDHEDFINLLDFLGSKDGEIMVRIFVLKTTIQTALYEYQIFFKKDLDHPFRMEKLPDSFSNLVFGDIVEFKIEPEPVFDFCFCSSCNSRYDIDGNEFSVPRIVFETCNVKQRPHFI